MRRSLARWFLALALVAMAAHGPPAPTQASQSTPCATVEFLPVGVPRVVSGTVYQKVRATRWFGDGHPESAVFPYPWIYPDPERTDPWSETNMKRANAPVALQFPPAGFDRSTLEPVLAFVIAHSDSRGHTTLAPCPRATPDPAPGGLAVLGRPATFTIPRSARLAARVYYLPHTASRDTIDEHSWVEVCVTVINRAMQPAKRVRFAFEYADLRGGIIGSDELNAGGTFLPQVEYGLPGRTDADAPLPHTFCRAMSLPATALRRLGEIRVFVRAIDYLDGSRWDQTSSSTSPGSTSTSRSAPPPSSTTP